MASAGLTRGARPAPLDHGRALPAGVRAAAVLGAYLLPAVVAYWHAWAHPASVAMGSGTGDPAQSIWYLRWVPWAIGGGHNPLFTVVANYPLGINLVVQTSTLALGLVLSPVTVLWGPVAAYNVAITTAFALSAGAGYLLARRFTTWRPAAFVAGLVYGYSPYLVGQGLGHLNLVFVPLPPLILLVLHDLVVRQAGSPWRSGLALGALVVSQFFVATEVLATTAVFAVLAVVVLAVSKPAAVRARVPYAAAGLGVAAGVAVAVLAYPAYILLAGPQHIAGPTPGFESYRSAALGPLLPTSSMLVSTPYLRSLGGAIGGNVAENGSYLGLPLVALVVLGAVAVRRRAARVAGVLALVAFVVSIGSPFRLGIPALAGFASSVPMPAAPLAHVPLLQDAYPVRYTLWVALFSSVVAAVTLDHIRARQAGRARPGLHALWPGRAPGWAVPSVLAVAALVPLLPAWPYPTQGPVAVPPFFSSPAVDAIGPGTVVVAYPWPDASDNQAQLWQAEAGMRFRLAGGYFIVPAGPARAFSYAPVTLASTVFDQLRAGPAPDQTPQLRRSLRSELAGWRVESMVASPPTGAAVDWLTWLVGRPPDQVTGGVAAWYHLRWPA